MSNSSNKIIVQSNLALRLVAVWAFLQLARLSSVAALPTIFAGDVPAEWLYPLLIDLLIGVSAPLVAFFIWQKNGVWSRMTALIWFAVACLAHVETSILSGVTGNAYAFWGVAVSAITLQLAFFAVLDAISFVILWRQMLRENPTNWAASRAKSRVMVILVLTWAFLQIPRYIAIAIIQNIVAGGTDPAAWLIPALGDIVVATLAPVVMFIFWRKQGLWVWAFTLIWLFLSIYDHLSTVTAAFTTPGPQIFGGGTSPLPSNATVPGVQTIVDAVLFIYLAREKVRLIFTGN